MPNPLPKPALRLASFLLPERIQESLVRSFCKPLQQQLCGTLTDQFLELLLRGMEVAFALSKSYRRNIEAFRATYVFKTRDGTVGVSAVFDNGNMTVDPQARPACDTLVTYRDAPALWSYLLSEDQDTLDSILAASVEVEGNLNNIYKYGYLVRDLMRRLGAA
jgi:hypothetical protein